MGRDRSDIFTIIAIVVLTCSMPLTPKEATSGSVSHT